MRMLQQTKRRHTNRHLIVRIHPLWQPRCHQLRAVRFRGYMTENAESTTTEEMIVMSETAIETSITRLVKEIVKPFFSSISGNSESSWAEAVREVSL